MIITIDGPSGTGKSTAARNLARKLGFLYLDTGAMYRAMALKAVRQKVSLTNRRQLSNLARNTSITFRKGAKGTLGVFLDGREVTQQIRSPKIAVAASHVAVVPGVRAAMVRLQKRIAAKGQVVAEGRDTGTVVFPKAQIKVYLSSSLQERARRRYLELKELGHRVSFRQVLKEARLRDQRDRNRATSPLKPAPGAIRIDNTALQSPQVVAKIMAYVRKARKDNVN